VAKAAPAKPLKKFLARNFSAVPEPGVRKHLALAAPVRALDEHVECFFDTSTPTPIDGLCRSLMLTRPKRSHHSFPIRST
jgi:hypothetical protein